MSSKLVVIGSMELPLDREATLSTHETHSAYVCHGNKWDQGLFPIRNNYAITLAVR